MWVKVCSAVERVLEVLERDEGTVVREGWTKRRKGHDWRVLYCGRVTRIGDGLWLETGWPSGRQRQPIAGLGTRSGLARYSWHALCIRQANPAWLVLGCAWHSLGATPLGGVYAPQGLALFIGRHSAFARASPLSRPASPRRSSHASYSYPPPCSKLGMPTAIYPSSSPLPISHP